MPKKKPARGFRTEHDLLGSKRVPASAYYGVQTLRALENFRISGVPKGTFALRVVADGYAEQEVEGVVLDRLVDSERSHR